jgi:hypothetical protein
MKWQILFLALSVLALASLWACGGSSTSAGLSITFAKQPPASLQSGSQATISTTVTNDSGGKGVDWTLACASSICGSLNPIHTASNSPTTFTAPAVIPTGNAVTITATATADTSKTATATVLITGAAISIAFVQAPPASLMTGAKSAISAVVSSDSSNAGVDWMVTCGNPNCGSLQPTHSASGSTVTYAAPTAIVTAFAVTITATASADTSKSVVAKVTITLPAIYFSQPPPASMATSAQAVVSATVLNDPANLGVDWSVTCSSSDCGSFNPTHTASGSATTYTAPATVPAGSTVTITARATANSSETVTAKVTITTSALSLLQGTYAFFFTGNDANSFFAVAGSLSADGKGNVTAGEEDFCDTSFVSLGNTVSGTYTAASDGRGTMTLKVSDPAIGVNGVQTLSFAVITSRHVVVIEFDGSATSNGTLELQNPANFSTNSITGGYGFTMSGLDGNGSPEDTGGVFNADGAGKFNGTQDTNDSGVVSNGPVSGTYSAPDSFGRGTATLGSVNFIYYVVDSGNLKFVESDLASSGALIAGSAFAQGSGPFSNASLSGDFVFTVAGGGVSGGSLIGPLAAGGLFIADGKGAITSGTIDVNNFGTVTSGSFTGTYSVSSNGRGTVTISGTTGGLSQFAVYLTANHGMMLLGLDTTSFSAGATFSQSAGISAATFSGRYAAQFDAAPAVGGPSFTQEDLDGQIVADGVSTFSGSVDINQFTVTPLSSKLFPNTSVTGTFSANPDGRFTGTFISSVTSTLNLVYYVASGANVLFIGLDSTQVTAGTMQSQQF